jgi:hypothetical protein
MSDTGNDFCVTRAEGKRNVSNIEPSRTAHTSNEAPGPSGLRSEAVAHRH